MCFFGELLQADLNNMLSLKVVALAFEPMEKKTAEIPGNSAGGLFGMVRLSDPNSKVVGDLQLAPLRPRKQHIPGDSSRDLLKSPNVGGHRKPLKGSRELTIPKKSRSQKCQKYVLFSWPASGALHEVTANQCSYQPLLTPRRGT